MRAAHPNIARRWALAIARACSIPSVCKHRGEAKMAERPRTPFREYRDFRVAAKGATFMSQRCDILSPCGALPPMAQGGAQGRGCVIALYSVSCYAFLACIGQEVIHDP